MLRIPYKLILVAFLSLLLFVTNQSAKAQFENIIAGVGSGFNNHTGLIGVYAESMVKYKVAGRISAGYGMWGGKFSLGPRYYFNYPRGENVGISFSYVTGRSSVVKQMNTITDGRRNINYDLGPAFLIDLVVNHHWMYRKVFRFTAEAGYSIPLNTAKITNNNPECYITDQDSEWLRVERPGGIIIGASVAYIFKIK